MQSFLNTLLAFKVLCWNAGFAVSACQNPFHPSVIFHFFQHLIPPLKLNPPALQTAVNALFLPPVPIAHPAPRKTWHSPPSQVGRETATQPQLCMLHPKPEHGRRKGRLTRRCPLHASRRVSLFLLPARSLAFAHDAIGGHGGLLTLRLWK